MKVLFVVPSGDFLPSGIVRVRQYLPLLDQLGIRHTVLSYYSPRLDRLVTRLGGGSAPSGLNRLIIAGAGVLQLLTKWTTRLRMLWRAPQVDLVFLQGILPPAWHIFAMRRLNPHVVLDLDDAIFLGNPHRGAAVMRGVSQVVAGSHFIFNFAQQYAANVTLVPSAVSPDRYQPRESPVSDPARPIRIGWLGSASTVGYLSQLAGPLKTLVAEGHRIALQLDGVTNHANSTPISVPGLPVECTGSYRDEDIPALVSAYDIGVMPLDDGPWEQAKCAMKAIIYMAAGKPVVCSAVGENCYVIEDGRNGFLAASEAEWTSHLRALINDAQLRRELGRRGRATVDARYSATVCFGLLRQHVFSRAEAVSAGVTS